MREAYGVGPGCRAGTHPLSGNARAPPIGCRPLAAEGKDVSPFGDLLGVEWVSTEPDRAQARIEVRADLTQPYGYLHGGVIMAIVDELCSRSTLMQVISEGMVALGQSMEISMVRTVASGSVTV